MSTGDGSYTSTKEQSTAQRAQAQVTFSLKGKILRISDTGAAPAGNFGNPVFAYRLRNLFGFDFDPPLIGRLWAADNGPDPAYPGEPSGPGPNGGCNDELNLVSSGANYGWGPTGSCGVPPPPPLNTNQDGPSPVLPKLTVEVASGITAATFCAECGLGAEYEGG